MSTRPYVFVSPLALGYRVYGTLSYDRQLKLLPTETTAILQIVTTSVKLIGAKASTTTSVTGVGMYMSIWNIVLAASITVDGPVMLKIGSGSDCQYIAAPVNRIQANSACLAEQHHKEMEEGNIGLC